jgi:superfamily II RNA helicase
MGRKLKKRFGIFNIEQPLEFISVIRHHKSDVWNETLGKHIAESKCKKKIYNFYYRLYQYIYNEIFSSDIKDLARYVCNLGFCQDREEIHFKDLIGN